MEVAGISADWCSVPAVVLRFCVTLVCMDPLAHPGPSHVSRRWGWTVLFFLLLLADLYHAGVQYDSTPLDGDMPPGVMITWDVQKIFDDPLGIQVIRTGYGHANPNRFFCHWGFANYFRTAPRLLQQLVDPLQSVYLACALLKIFVHVGIALLLALFARSRAGGGWSALLLLMFLISPLFQIEHYRMSIGIIDQSVTYTFFYGLPALGFLLLLWCFHLLLSDRPLRPFPRVLLFLFTLAFRSSFPFPVHW